ncbi:MAG: nodulation protein NfeD [Chloroflexota bacterium]|nr:nodulation protein NfeD [Chloroflexota bacterium]
MSRQTIGAIVTRTVLLTALAALPVFLFAGAVERVAAQDDQPTVVVLTFKGAVTPVLNQYLDTAIDAALAAGSEAIILQLDTPGGSVEVTKAITQDMLASPVPIIVYVAPTGAQAASAGTFVTLAGHAAAMAPGASIGAASPVSMDGGEIDATMQAKITNILSADIENLAERRGEEATQWAIAAVQDAAAATAAQALDLGVIDIIATDVDDLLAQLDGREVLVRNEARMLRTAGAIQSTLEMTPLQRFLNLIASPTVASILLTLGILGLVVEIRTPGFGFAGIVGIVSLLLAFYGLGQLDANLAGLALMAAALALFIAEAFTPTFGILALGGMIAFVFGAVLLFNTPGLKVPWAAILSLAALLGGLTIFAGSKALAAQRRPPLTGGDALIGLTARAKSAFAAGEEGAVFIQGEWWNAVLTDGAVEANDKVRVTARRGYTLEVEPLEKDKAS